MRLPFAPPPAPLHRPAASVTITAIATARAAMDSSTNAYDSDADGPDPSPAAYLGPPKRPDELGTLGRYRVLKQLGAGGMGAVFLGIDEALDRKVALKVMLPRHAARPTAKERFLREARAAAKVKSDHVITLHEVGEANGVPFIAMEYLQGQPLDEFLKTNGNPTAAQILRIGREVAAGLADAHALGLVHRDIKPANLWLEAPKGRVKILDFGLARSQTEDVQLTHSGAIVGTPAFMSPEQGLGKPLDGRSDLFSLGGVLYRLCTGKLPFPGHSPMEVLTRLATEDPAPVRGLNPDVPEPLAKLIHTLLAKKPDDRYATAEDVVRAIGTIEASAAGSGLIVVGGQSESVFAHLEETGASFANTQSVATVVMPKASPARKAPWPLIGGVAAGGVIVVVAAVVLFNKYKPKPPDPKPPGPEVVERKDKPKEKDTPPAAAFPPGPSAADLLTSPDWEWAAPENLGPAVNTADEEMSASVTADGLRLVFAGKRGDRWTLHEASRARAEDAFGDPAELTTLDGNPHYTAQPWVSGDGLYLAFVSIRPDGFGQTDIWETRRPDRHAPWGRPALLDGNVNTEAGEDNVALSPDGLTLYFSSDRAGTADIYASRRKSTAAPWEPAAPLGPEVNTPGAERNPRPLADGKGLLFLRMPDPKGKKLSLMLATPGPGGKWATQVVPSRGLWHYSLSFSADGRTLYFDATDAGLPGIRGKSDLYQMRRVPKAKAGAGPDAERTAAEALLPHANMTLKLAAGGALVKVQPGGRLPGSAFTVTRIEFTAESKTPPFVADVLLPAVAGMAGLEQIDSQMRVPTTGGELAALADMPAAKTLTQLVLAAPLTADTRAALRKFPKLVRLRCFAPLATDQLVTALTADHPALIDLGLAQMRGATLTRASWEAIAKLPLNALDLSGVTCLDSAGAKILAGLPGLEYLLLLDSTGVTDAVAREFTAARYLRVLNLQGTAVTDDCLVALNELKTLKAVTLRKTGVTAAGVAKFKAARPDVKVEWDDPAAKK